MPARDAGSGSQLLCGNLETIWLCLIDADVLPASYHSLITADFQPQLTGNNCPSKTNRSLTQSLIKCQTKSPDTLCSTLKRLKPGPHSLHVSQYLQLPNSSISLLRFTHSMDFPAQLPKYFHCPQKKYMVISLSLSHCPLIPTSDLTLISAALIKHNQNQLGEEMVY